MRSKSYLVILISLLFLSAAASAQEAEYWFNEASSPLVDQTGNGNNGTWSGSINHGVPGISKGSGDWHDGEAYEFDSADSEDVDISSGDPIGSSPSQFAMSGWVKTSDGGSNNEQTIIHLSGSDNSVARLEIRSGTLYYIHYTGSNVYDTGSITDIADDAWNHVGVSVDQANGAAYLYVNGNIEETLSLGGNVDLSGSRSDRPEHIGSRADSKYFDGDIDELKIYSQNLTSTQMSNLYTCNSESSCPNVISFSQESPNDKSRKISNNADLSVKVENTEGIDMNVTFHWGNGTEISENNYVSSGSVTSTPNLDLSSGKSYEWYVNATDGSTTSVSNNYIFATEFLGNNDPYLDDFEGGLYYSNDTINADGFWNQIFDQGSTTFAELDTSNPISQDTSLKVRTSGDGNNDKKEWGEKLDPSRLRDGYKFEGQIRMNDTGDSAALALSHNSGFSNGAAYIGAFPYTSSGWSCYGDVTGAAGGVLNESIASPQPNTVYNLSLTYHSDAVDCKIEYENGTLVGEHTGANLSSSYDFDQFRIYAQDRDTESQSIYFDNVPHKISSDRTFFDVHQPKNKTVEGDIPIQVSSPNSSVNYKYSLDGGSNVSFTPNTSISTSSGDHSLQIWANESSKTVSFYSDPIDGYDVSGNFSLQGKQLLNTSSLMGNVSFNDGAITQNNKSNFFVFDSYKFELFGDADYVDDPLQRVRLTKYSNDQGTLNYRKELPSNSFNVKSEVDWANNTGTYSTWFFADRSSSGQVPSSSNGYRFKMDLDNNNISLVKYSSGATTRLEQYDYNFRTDIYRPRIKYNSSTGLTEFFVGSANVFNSTISPDYSNRKLYFTADQRDTGSNGTVYVDTIEVTTDYSTNYVSEDLNYDSVRDPVQISVEPDHWDDWHKRDAGRYLENTSIEDSSDATFLLNESAETKCYILIADRSSGVTNDVFATNDTMCSKDYTSVKQDYNSGTHTSIETSKDNSSVYIPYSGGSNILETTDFLSFTDHTTNISKIGDAGLFYSYEKDRYEIYREGTDTELDISNDPLNTWYNKGTVFDRVPHGGDLEVLKIHSLDTEFREKHLWIDSFRTDPGTIDSYSGSRHLIQENDYKYKELGITTSPDPFGDDQEHYGDFYPACSSVDDMCFAFAESGYDSTGDGSADQWENVYLDSPGIAEPGLEVKVLADTNNDTSDGFEESTGWKALSVDYKTPRMRHIKYNYNADISELNTSYSLKVEFRLNHSKKYYEPEFGGYTIESVEGSTSDTSPPSLTIHSPTNSTIKDSEVNLNVTSTEAANYTYNVDGGTNQTSNEDDTDLNTTLSGLSDGGHTVNVWAEDSSGNTGFASQSFTVDTTDPTASIISPENITYQETSSVYLNVTRSDSTSGVQTDEYNLDDIGYTSFTPNTTITGLNEGTHNIKYRVTDNAGNSVVKEEDFSINITQKYFVESIPAGKAVAPVSNPISDLTLWSNAVAEGSTNVLFGNSLGSDYAGELRIDFQQNVSAGNLVVDTNRSSRKSVLHNSDSISNVLEKSLLIPRENQSGKVKICPSAQSLSDVNSSCSSGYNISTGETVNGVTLSEVSYNDVDYYKASGVTGTGGFEYEIAETDDTSSGGGGGGSPSVSGNISFSHTNFVFKESETVESYIIVENSEATTVPITLSAGSSGVCSPFQFETGNGYSKSVSLEVTDRERVGVQVEMPDNTRLQEFDEWVCLPDVRTSADHEDLRLTIVENAGFFYLVEDITGIDLRPLVEPQEFSLSCSLNGESVSDCEPVSASPLTVFGILAGLVVVGLWRFS